MGIAPWCSSRGDHAGREAAKQQRADTQPQLVFEDGTWRCARWGTPAALLTSPRRRTITSCKSSQALLSGARSSLRACPCLKGPSLRYSPRIRKQRFAYRLPSKQSLRTLSKKPTARKESLGTNSSRSCGSTAELGVDRTRQTRSRAADRRRCCLVERKPPCGAGSYSLRPEGRARSPGRAAGHRHFGREHPRSRNSPPVLGKNALLRLLPPARDVP